MSLDQEKDKIPSSSEIKFWIHECHRYLFLTKIHLEDSVLPEIEGDPLKYFESIINLSHYSTEEDAYTNKLLFQESGEEPTLISIKDEFEYEFGLDKDEISLTKEIFKKITTNNHKDINIKEIEEIQKILFKLLKSIQNNLNNIKLSYNIAT